MQNERRTHPRLSFGGKAYLTYDGRCRCESVTDVSAEGLFLETGARIREGKQVKVFNVMDGQVIAEFEVEHAIGATTSTEGGNLKMRGSLNRDGSRLLAVTLSTGFGVKRDSSLSLWDVDTQKRLWKSTWQERCVAEFSSEDRLFLITDWRWNAFDNGF